MNFMTLFKAVDAVMTLRRGPTPGDAVAPLTGVLVGALKEAFNRDRARLDLERYELDEQSRRAERALRLELRRQAADREIGRLRLLAGAALLGWIASLVMLAARTASFSTPARAILAVGWLFLLGALGAAFTAQRRIGVLVPEDDRPLEADAAGTAALWLLIAGLAMTALTLLI